MRTIAIGLVALLTMSSCTDEEIELFLSLDHDEQVAFLHAYREAERRELQLHPRLTCLRRRESDRGAPPHINGYEAQNPSSSASGAYGFIDSTWATMSHRAGHPGYAKARYAPWWVQDLVAYYTLYRSRMGILHWSGSGC